MRLLKTWTVFAAAALCTFGQAQVWEKYLAPGLTYRMEIDPEVPRTIHALHFNFHSDRVYAMPVLGQGKVYNNDPTLGRATVTSMVKQNKAVAGVNASYFPYTGRPVGLMVKDGELISSPYKGRPEFGWGPNQVTHFGMSGFDASFKSAEIERVTIDTINEEDKVDAVALDTDTGGWMFAKIPATIAILKTGGAKLTPIGGLDAEVVEIQTNVSRLEIPKDEAILVGTGTKADIVGRLKPGNRVSIAVHVDGFDWDKVTNVVCGGPVLLKNGAAVLDWKTEAFNEEFSLKRHPRTAVGIDRRGDLWLVAVDGQLSESGGASLEELAAILLRLGCRDAINLDGGGSTTVNSFGITVNRPADGVERELANAILFFGPEVPKEKTDMVLHAPDSLKLGDKMQISVVKSDGERVSDLEILWAASGGAWIDQGGLLHVDRTDPIVLSAYVHGETLTKTIKVEDVK
jgi:hypothetical protein